MAKWMVNHGARTVVLVSRNGSVTEKVQSLIDSVSASGAQIVVKSCDIVDKESVETLFTSGLSDLPPVAGLVHGAMVLRVSALPPSHFMQRPNNNFAGRALREDEMG